MTQYEGFRVDLVGWEPWRRWLFAFYYCKWVYSTGLLLGIALQKIISKDLQKQKYKAFSTYPSFSTVHCSHINQSGHNNNFNNQ